MNYMLLSLKKRINDYETFGSLFRAVKEVILEATLIEKIWIVFIEIFNKFLANLGVDWEIFIGELIKNEKEVNLINIS